MDRSRLMFVEGIMGSGKSTTVRWLARLYRRTGIPASARGVGRDGLNIK